MEKILVEGLENFLNQDVQVTVITCKCIGRCTCGKVAYPDYGVEILERM